MKKSAFALLIASLCLTGCNEKEINSLKQQLQTSEQTVSQLQAELAKSKEQVPFLKVTPVTIIEKNEQFKFNRKPEDFGVTESHFLLFIRTAETGIEWLDNLLYKNLLSGYQDEKGNINTGLVSPEKVQQIQALPNVKEKFVALAKSLAEGESYQTAKDGESLGEENILDLSYLGQRNNIITFMKSVSEYHGGAHGLDWEDYINIDSNKKSILTINDIIPEKNQQAVKDALWKAYVERNYDIPENELPISQKDMYISSAFYFSAEGINFVYPPYAIGPYAEGSITLTISWAELNNLITPEYQW